MSKRRLLNGVLIEHLHNKDFAELFGGPVHVHVEKIGDCCLWIRFDEGADPRISIRVQAEKDRKLSVRVYNE